jgi:dTDP-L-rhamnose 4-epimerase
MIHITDGAGFIGSHIVELVVEDGHEVRVLGALLPAARREQPAIRSDPALVGRLAAPSTCRAAGAMKMRARI